MYSEDWHVNCGILVRATVDCKGLWILSTMLRDCLVCGVYDPSIRKHLLVKEDDLSFMDAATQASTMESAVLDSNIDIRHRMG